MIYGRAFYGNENGEPADDFYPEHCPEGDLFWELMRWNFIPCPAVVFRRACLTRVGLLDDEIPGMRRFHTYDPHGNRLEFLAPVD